MAVKLRLKRFGRKKLPIYRLVVADERSPRDGRVVEEVGFYNPTPTPKVFDCKQDRVEYWLSVGAQPTDPVQRLLAEAGLIKKVERKRFKKRKKEVPEEETVALPSENPLQLTRLVIETFATIGVGSVIVKEVVKVHPLASVIKQV